MVIIVIVLAHTSQVCLRVYVCIHGNGRALAHFVLSAEKIYLRLKLNNNRKITGR